MCIRDSAIVEAGVRCDDNGFEPPCVLNRPLTLELTLELDASVANVSDHFVSFTLDASAWRSLNLSDPLLATLMGHAAPALLRVGGTQEDYDV